MPGRRVLVVRHGERCDFSFNGQGDKNWYRRSVDSNGKYKPFDLNLPRNLPVRNGGMHTDTALTEIGYLQSKITGRAFRDYGVTIDCIYASPALRCVQTAVGILKGMSNDKIKLRIEPGLFEWMQWCKSGRPMWMSTRELLAAGYPIDADYQPVMKDVDLNLDESLNAYYRRSHDVSKSIVEKHSSGTILLVAHGASLDTLTRGLYGAPPRSNDEFFFILQHTPYLACTEARESSDGHWRVVGSPIPPLHHAANAAYDSTLLQMTPAALSERAAASVHNKRY
uniref:Protein UBASH3A-like protein n=1 Tax=Steinernema glaseri TaxID=37863 RepID=A0A1I8A4H2_9BILA